MEAEKEKHETDGGGDSGRVEFVESAHEVSTKEDAVEQTDEHEISLVRFIFSCMVAGGVHYGWTLQLSLLTPYVQTLGLSHGLSFNMWLCGLPCRIFYESSFITCMYEKFRLLLAHGVTNAISDMEDAGPSYLLDEY